MSRPGGCRHGPGPVRSCGASGRALAGLVNARSIKSTTLRCVVVVVVDNNGDFSSVRREKTAPAVLSPAGTAPPAVPPTCRVWS